MPIITHIDKSKDLTTFSVTGVLLYDEVISAAKVFYDGNPTKHVLCNLLDTSESLFTLEQTEKLVSFQPRFEGKREPGKTAILVKGSLLSGLSNVVGTQNNVMGTPHTVMVFNSKETAYKWLDEP